MTPRQENILSGAAELRRWLLDTFQLGLAERYTQPPAYWQDLAARLVDRQAAGLANRIRVLGNTFQSDQWQEQAVQQLAELFLLCEGYAHHQNLPAPLQQELWNQAGIGIKKKDLLLQDGQVDDWRVMGQRVVLETRLDLRRTWLYSETHDRYALLLEYAVGDRDFEFRGKVGNAYEMEMVFYPGAFPLRAWYQAPFHDKGRFLPPKQYMSHLELLNAYATALKENPFLMQFPACLSQVIPDLQAEEVVLIDAEQTVLSLPPSYAKSWNLLAAGGGHPITIFGEWNGRHFHPLALADRDLWIKL